MTVQIRATTREDIEGLKQVLDSSKLFPSEFLDEMISNYFNNPHSEEIWFTCLDEQIIVGFGYCVPERLTNGTYNLLAIAVRNDLQGKGIGRKMMEYIEQRLKENKKRVLIVETSSLDQYELTRKFYENLNYKKEAIIRDFWKEGEDKIVYWKKII